jgi:hypothetical protein
MDHYDFLPKLNKTAKKYYERVQEKLHYCVTCQPYEGGDYIWIFGKSIELDELFDDFSVPDRYRDDIAQHLSCPNCGREVFERWEEVGLEDPYDAELRKTVRAAETKFGRKLDSFQSHLKQYPSLSLSHPLGRKIQKEISSGNLPACKVSGSFFRARLVKGSNVFDAEDMGAPPTGVSLDGRYHHAGQSVLYIGKDEEVAINEILEPDVEKALVWVQEYEIAEIDKILDLRSNEEKITTFTSPLLIAILSKRALEKKVKDPKRTWKPQYFITRFISDCSRASGFNGIRYSSTRCYGENIILFYPEKIEFKKIGKPKVLIYEKTVQAPFLINTDFDIDDLI